MRSSHPVQKLVETSEIFKCKTWNLPEENVRERLYDTDIGGDILDMNPKAKIHMWDHKKLESFCVANGTNGGMKRWCTKREEISAHYT